MPREVAVEQNRRSQNAEVGTSKTITRANQKDARASGERGQIQREPSPDQVAQRAYDLYRLRGGEDGHDMDDWFQAEAELRPR